MDHLNRSQAPIGGEFWKTLDEAAVGAARAILTARRFLDVEGPFGVGLTAIEVGDDGPVREETAERAGLIAGRVLAVPLLRKSFALSVRRLAAHGQQGQPLDLTAVERAAEDLAASEEDLIYHGEPKAGLVGLLTVPGRQEAAVRDWGSVETALEDVLAAVTKLGKAGFRGPYALALSPERFNSLFRLYEDSNLSQIKHFNQICARGVFKAPIDGGVVVDPRAGKIIIGQDLAVGFSRSDGTHHHLYLTESLVLRVDDPGAVCSFSTSAAAPAPQKAARRK